MNKAFMRVLVMAGFAASPLLAFAQDSFNNFIDTVSAGINTIIIFLFLVATVIFLWGVLIYIAAGGY